MLTKTFDLTDKIALITGASRGIGRALALEMAKRGAHILAVARNVKYLESLDDEIKQEGSSSTLIPLDLAQSSHAKELKEKIESRWGRLDILVLNAAMLGPLTPITDIDEQDLYQIFLLNSFSCWQLLKTLHPLLQKSEAARILVMSSSVARKARAFWGAYGASKAALEIFARSYAEENAHSKIRINLANPGGTRTKMRAEAMPGEDPTTLPSPAEVAASLVQLVNPQLTENGQLFDYRQNKFIADL